MFKYLNYITQNTLRIHNKQQRQHQNMELYKGKNAISKYSGRYTRLSMRIKNMYKDAKKNISLPMFALYYKPTVKGNRGRPIKEMQRPIFA